MITDYKPKSLKKSRYARHSMPSKLSQGQSPHLWHLIEGEGRLELFLELSGSFKGFSMPAKEGTERNPFEDYVMFRENMVWDSITHLSICLNTSGRAFRIRFSTGLFSWPRTDAAMAVKMGDAPSMMNEWAGNRQGWRCDDDPDDPLSGASGPTMKMISAVSSESSNKWPVLIWPDETWTGESSAGGALGMTTAALWRAALTDDVSRESILDAADASAVLSSRLELKPFSPGIDWRLAAAAILAAEQIRASVEALELLWPWPKSKS